MAEESKNSSLVPCLTMSEFESLTLSVLRGETDPQVLRQHERHLLTCSRCSANWTIEELLTCVPGGVWDTHLDTVAKAKEKLAATQESHLRGAFASEEQSRGATV